MEKYSPKIRFPEANSRFPTPGDKRARQVFGGFGKTSKVVQNEAILSGAVDKEIAFS